MPPELVRVFDPADLLACRTMLEEGSKSFATAARLLPSRVRDSATVFYAFCRAADDAVDLGEGPARALKQLRARVDRIYSGVPIDNPVDRTMTSMVRIHALPRGVVDALIEGLAWDVEERVYETFGELLDYCMRVASAVGVAMSVIMGVRDASALARACDLGAAMQLTNIARDVGEDARMGRIYLPRQWLRRAGVDADAFVADPRPTPQIRGLVADLLERADALYQRGDAGIAKLPPDCRSAVGAASRIYSDIGRVIASADYDSITRRAYVSKPRKVWLAFLAWIVAPTTAPEIYAQHPLPNARFLIDAVKAA